MFKDVLFCSVDELQIGLLRTIYTSSITAEKKNKTARQRTT